MLLLDSEAISCIAHGPERRREQVRALVLGMRAKGHPVATVAAVLAEVVRGRPADAGVFAGLRRERVQVHPVDTRVGVRAGQLLGQAGSGQSWRSMRFSWLMPTCGVARSLPPSTRGTSVSWLRSPKECASSISGDARDAPERSVWRAHAAVEALATP